MNDKTELDMHCGNCTYVNSIAVTEPDGKPIIGKTQLVCMWGPPSVVVLQIPTPAGMQVSIRSQFPPVTEHICCHRHSFDPDDLDMLSGDLMEPSANN